MPTNTLYDYYKAQGKSLPSVAERATLATQHGITGYTGTAEQNTALLSKLSGTGGSGALPPSSVPPGGLETTPGTNPPASDLANMRTALRSALNEAAQKTASDRMTALSGLVGGGAAPSVINAAIGLAQQGLAQGQESVASEALKIFDDQRKAMEFNPEQYRSVDGGIYDLKNNRWVVNPKDDSGTAGKTLTRTDTEKLGLPPTLTGTSWSMFKTQVENSTPPSWFRTLAENKMQQSLLPEKLTELWNQFRQSFTGTFDSAGGGATAGGSLNFDDF